MNWIEDHDIPEVGVEELKFPEWHTLSQKHLGQDVHEEDYRFFSSLDESCLLLDVGANIGNSIHSVNLVNSCLPIISFEPNPGLWSFIENVISRVSNDVKLCKFGLSNQDGFMYLYIPVVDGIHIVGEASVELDHFSDSFVQNRLRSYSRSGSFGLIKTRIELKRFDNLQINPSHIKIDVEGHEVKVLEGMIETIERCKPVFLIESDKTFSVDSFLKNYGYSAYNYIPSLGELKPKDFDNLNTFFLPN